MKQTMDIHTSDLWWGGGAILTLTGLYALVKRAVLSTAENERVHREIVSELKNIGLELAQMRGEFHSTNNNLAALDRHVAGSQGGLVEFQKSQSDNWREVFNAIRMVEKSLGGKVEVVGRDLARIDGANNRHGGGV